MSVYHKTSRIGSFCKTHPQIEKGFMDQAAVGEADGLQLQLLQDSHQSLSRGLALLCSLQPLAKQERHTRAWPLLPLSLAISPSAQPCLIL